MIPFFIHCDDVEYGLRYGQQPVILNGIQVWHETYEHRQSPVMHYYDTRNPLIVNALYKSGQDAETIKKEWFEKITGMHNAGDALSEYMCIRAMLDFLKGPAWVFGQDVRKQKAGRYMNSLLWRYTKALFDRDFTGVIRRYETYVQRYRRKD